MNMTPLNRYSSTNRNSIIIGCGCSSRNRRAVRNSRILLVHRPQRVLASYLVASCGPANDVADSAGGNGGSRARAPAPGAGTGAAVGSPQFSRPLDVIIIGGGIGGLTTAAALLEAGIRVRVFEARRREDSMTGPGGIQIQANAEKVFRLLSSPWPPVRDGSSSNSSSSSSSTAATTVAAATTAAGSGGSGNGGDSSSNLSDAIYVVGGPIMSGGFRSQKGDYLYYADIDSIGLEDVKSNGLSISRRSLQTILSSVLPYDCVSFGRRFQKFTAPPDGAIGRIKVAFEDGGVEECDVLVGADGIRSKVREQLLGTPPELTYGGNVCWRGRLPLSRIGRGADWLLKAINMDSWAEYWGKGVRIGFFTVGPEATPDETVPGGIRLEGEPQLAWYAFAIRPESWEPEPGSDEAVRLRKLFEGFASPVPELLEAVEPSAVHLGKIMYHKPRPAPWGAGRVTLLGDAAHAMLPTLGQGGCMAIEDALELVNELGEAVAATASHNGGALLQPASTMTEVTSYDTVAVSRLEAALRRYEASRAPRVARVSEQSVQVAALAMADTDLTAWIRDTIYRLTPKWAGDKQFEYLFKDYVPAWKDGVRLGRQERSRVGSSDTEPGRAAAVAVSGSSGGDGGGGAS
ncbi:hypothetical protein Vretimale_14561 [Volvox reticuliferus]|uniref:FAD-binding domain-containing protein n=1 Tax=Volvox reticuliferus TaxID=1737510 RepID=A0A8J4FRX8_9CHLO|nr:hypothetical protein Vretifemale_13286 [Volvox reticuliferus]GIM10975.1 hypothetical protein Vretimale_14561 [Volvox reticuliferus]